METAGSCAGSARTPPRSTSSWTPPPTASFWRTSSGQDASLSSVGMTRYTSATDADRRAMLDAIGAGSVDELFDQVPPEVRLDRDLDLPAGLTETECFDHLASLAERNAHADTETCFLGAGMYDHYVPAIVDAITQRSEFLTPYTPYQPEVSQGGLQV